MLGILVGCTAAKARGPGQPPLDWAWPRSQGSAGCKDLWHLWWYFVVVTLVWGAGDCEAVAPAWVKAGCRCLCHLRLYMCGDGKGRYDGLPYHTCRLHADVVVAPLLCRRDSAWHAYALLSEACMEYL